jgi:hypothetical protein
MSLLSDFLQKPYAGLSRSGDTLTFSTGSARMILDSSDSTITGLGLPELILKTNYMAAGSGGWLRFRAPNSVGTLKDAASIRGSFSTTTDGAEDGSITVEVYVDGTPAQFRFDGNNKTFRPVGSVLMALGTSSARWDGAYLGDGTISGDVIPANGGFTIGSASSHSVFFKAGDVIRGWLDVAGRFSLGAAPSSATFLSLGGGNPSTLSSIYGFAALYDSPSTATVESTAFLASHKTVAASFTVAKHIGFRSADFTKGASSAITAQIGFQADDLTQGSQTYGFYSLVNTGSNRYGFYAAGTAANFLLGGLYIGTGTPPSTESLHVQSATITQGVAGFKQTNASATADIVTITGGANSSIYNAFKITDGTALKLTVRGDGVTFLGDSTTQRNGALFNVVGRTDLTPNQTHDLVTNTIAVTLYSGGSISVASAKQNNMVSL